MTIFFDFDKFSINKSLKKYGTLMPILKVTSKNLMLELTFVYENLAKQFHEHLKNSLKRGE